MINVLAFIITVLAVVQLVFILRIHDYWQKTTETLASVKLLEEKLQMRLDGITEFYKDLIKK
jgi:hypothetical protein